MQRIAKLTVWIILQILSLGSDQQKNNKQIKVCFYSLLRVYFKYFYTTTTTTSWTDVSNKTRTIPQIISVDEYNKVINKVNNTIVLFSAGIYRLLSL